MTSIISSLPVESSMRQDLIESIFLVSGNSANGEKVSVVVSGDLLRVCVSTRQYTLSIKSIAGKIIDLDTDLQAQKEKLDG